MYNLEERIKKAKKEILDTSNIITFDNLYTFTTENINGYINKFNLKDKSLLTVGSSSDQVINANFLGCNDITLIDINHFTKDFFYLKKAAITELSYKEFFKFMSMEGTIKRNNKSYNLKTFERIIDKIDDEEAKIFWKELTDTFKPKEIKKLFTPDVPFTYELKVLNNYLKNEESYNKTKSTIRNLKPNFINANIYKYKLNRNYDNIFLSNIADYNKVDDTYELYNRLKDNLNPGGKILVAYLYGTNYMAPDKEINDLEQTSNLFNDAVFHSIKGREDIELRIRYIDYIPDDVLVYQKKK